MTLGWTDLEEGQELLVVAVPHRLYKRLKAYGKPRKIIAEALAQEPPKIGLRTVSVAGGNMVNVPLVVNRWTSESIRQRGGDDFILGLILEHLRILDPPEAPDPLPNYLGDGI